nr:PREDICTED: uncharacterized protein LOC109044487 isoform X2 [Bemisia tabaci]
MRVIKFQVSLLFYATAIVLTLSLVPVAFQHAFDSACHRLFKSRSIRRMRSLIKYTGLLLLVVLVFAFKDGGPEGVADEEEVARKTSSEIDEGNRDDESTFGCIRCIIGCMMMGDPFSKCKSQVCKPKCKRDYTEQCVECVRSFCSYNNRGGFLDFQDCPYCLGVCGTMLMQ